MATFKSLRVEVADAGRDAPPPSQVLGARKRYRMAIGEVLKSGVCARDRAFALLWSLLGEEAL